MDRKHLIRSCEQNVLVGVHTYYPATRPENWRTKPACRIPIEAPVKVSALLMEKRSLLEQLAHRLLEEEVVERDARQAMLAGAKPS